MLSRLLRQLLFFVVHFIINILVAIQNVYHQLIVKKCNFYEDGTLKSDVKMILEHKPRISKRLKHLVVLADTDHHSYEDLAKIVIWSLIAGVPYVSFHDITGDLKENEEKFFHEVERSKKDIPGCIKWSNKPDLNGYTNGGQAHTVIINIFTCNDGKPTIVQCIRHIAEEEIKCSKRFNELTAQEFNEVLSTMYSSIPDPDLVLYTGSLCCTHGLLPWQIRLTEFIQLSIDHSVNIDGFIHTMYKYNKCDQRFGK